MSNEQIVPNKQETKLSENLRRLLAAKGLTVSQAARKIGMNSTTLHNYCHGSVPRNILKLRDLASLLGTTIEDLVFGVAEDTVKEFTVEGRYEITVRRIPELKSGKK